MLACFYCKGGKCDWRRRLCSQPDYSGLYPRGREPIMVRSPYSIRPYQHVLDALYAYLMIAALQYDEPDYAGAYNVGPDEQDCISTGELVEVFIKYWGDGLQWETCACDRLKEANFLKLDCSKLKATFGWNPRWRVEQAVEKVVEWSKCQLNNGDVRACMDKQIDEFLNV